MLYHAFGFIVKSDIEIPEFQKLEKDLDYQITIKEDNLPNQLPSSPTKIEKAGFEKDQKTFLLTIPEVATFYIENGNTIIFDRSDTKIEDDSVRLFLLGTCMGIVMQQKGIICLHGSAIVYKDFVFTFVGKSGVGKSSILNYFLSKGAQILSDDIIRIEQTDDGYFAYPAYPQTKLWEDGVDHFEYKDKSLRKLRPELNKFGVKIGQDEFESKKKKVSKCITLSWNKLEEIKHRTVDPIEAGFWYRKNIYRIQAFVTPEEKQQIFQCSIDLAKKLPLINVSRPKGYPFETFTSFIESLLIDNK